MVELRTIDKEHGTIHLPRDVHEGVDLVEVERRPDGVIELRPKIAIDQSQAWFWSDRWQAMEREAEADISAGRVRRFNDAEELIADLDSE